MNTVKSGALACALMTFAAQPASALSIMDSITIAIPNMTAVDSDPDDGYDYVTAPTSNVSLALFDTSLGIATRVQMTTTLTGMLSASLNATNAAGYGQVTALVPFQDSDALYNQQFIYQSTPSQQSSSGTFTQTERLEGTPYAYLKLSIGDRFGMTVQTSLLADFHGDPDSTDLVVRLDNASLMASIEYTYVKHGMAAFDTPGTNSMVLDFGTVTKGSGALTKSFNVSNAADADSSALQYSSFEAAGSRLFHETAPFEAQTLTPGATTSVGLGFDPDTLGMHFGKFYLSFWDETVGAGQSGSTLIVYTTANVIDDVAAVPEPASWALMIGGFAMVGGRLRRRRPLRSGIAFN